MSTERQLAHKILNCGAFLTHYEISFLKRIPQILEKYGHLTSKQYNLLLQLQTKTNQTIERKPKHIKHNVALLMFNDLASIATSFTPSDKAIFRLQLRNYKERGANSLDKNQLWRLYKKYRENITL